MLRRKINAHLARRTVGRASVERRVTDPTDDLATLLHYPQRAMARRVLFKPFLAAGHRDRLQVGRHHARWNTSVVDGDNGRQIINRCVANLHKVCDGKRAEMSHAGVRMSRSRCGETPSSRDFQTVTIRHMVNLQFAICYLSLP